MPNVGHSPEGGNPYEALAGLLVAVLVRLLNL